MTSIKATAASAEGESFLSASFGGIVWGLWRLQPAQTRVKPAEQEQEQLFEQNADAHDRRRPREQVAGGEVHLGEVKFFADGAVGDADDFRGDARLPRQPDGDAAARQEVGPQGGKIDQQQPTGGRYAEKRRHLQKRGRRAFHPVEYVGSRRRWAAPSGRK